ncbi:unnamed protein product [Discula destructiva]
MYLPVPVQDPNQTPIQPAAASASGPVDEARVRTSRDRAASIRSHRAATAAAADHHAMRTTAFKPSSSSGARRSHRKVRTGCAKCKERKIKCDETKPSCWQCTRHNVVCDFSKSQPSPGSDASPSATDSGVSPGQHPGGTPVVSPDVTMEDATADLGAANTTDPFGPDAQLDAAAAADAFAFLKGSLNASRDGPPAVAQSTPTQMSYEPTSDPHYAAPSLAASRGVLLKCAAASHAALDMTDLFLLHHFTTVTAPSLNPWHDEVQQWWAQEVPRVAFRHPFVMRSLLALAGLHVVYLSNSGGDTGDDPSRHGNAAGTRSFHLARAIEQHKLAGQTASSMLSELDRSTSAPMYVFAVITQIISMALPRPQPGPNHIASWDNMGVQEWIRLMRGIKTIAELGKAWGMEGGVVLGARNEDIRLWEEHCKARTQELAKTGSLGGNGGSGGDPPPERRGRWRGMHEQPLADLRKFITGDDGGVAGRGNKDEDEDAEAMRRVCLRAVDQLDFVFASFLDRGDTLQTVRLTFSWLCELETRFLDSLSRHDPHCLLIFAHHAILLRWSERAWWLQGWGPRIVDSVLTILGGAESKYGKWAEWPRTQMALAAHR